jgi:hypothetical protein
VGLGVGAVFCRPWPAALLGVGRVGFCPYVENFTVDASIFVVIDKLLRAIGGCLGTKSR